MKFYFVLYDCYQYQHWLFEQDLPDVNYFNQSALIEVPATVNPERLKQVIEIAISRAQILIFTGGLGPTPDDLTCETIADFFGVPLI